MFKALTLLPEIDPDRDSIERILVREGLTPWTATAEQLLDLAQEPDVSLLLLGGNLFSALAAAEQARLAAICRHRHLPVLLSESTPTPLDNPGRFGWTCGIVHNPTDLGEWREKIAVYRQLGRLEHEVSDLQNKLEVRWREDEDDLRSAAQIQRSLLPRHMPSLTRFNISSQFHPYEKIGGDLFNVRQVDEETLMLFLLDVSGHGISSAMVSISVYQSLSLHTGQIVKRAIDTPPYYRLLPPDEVMLELASEYPFERFEMFFTIVYMLININTGQLRYSSAGHPPPILLRQSGELERLRTGGGLIGLPDTGPFEQGETVLQGGDRLFLFSDGLIDHCDIAGECFGEQRLIQALSRDGADLPQVCRSAIDNMVRFRGKMPAQDDVSLLGVEFTGPNVQASP